ncbi:extracellular solute-binding protein [Anaerotruncus rubiinfantis]|uniref:extracellular solute-binding protein n=1 Tax=Anaerotruncus rubiinfantis TaxID=1720200 RepID=UPI00189C3C1E|nr:extracellular solute-binding protein [Anaerotruncus rubiinfantis]
MKSRLKHFTVLLVALALLTAGCAKAAGKSPLNPKEPVTVSMWHNFGGEMQTTIDALIDEFNSTVGRDQGIIINVTAITSSAELQKSLNMIASGDPGAPAMPDIATAYPKTAILFQQKGMLANLDDYFTEEELAGYVPQFVEEGRIGDGLYVFPISKSTEILYLNQTLFDQFAVENQVTMECFSTFEGLADAAQKYYDWTDAKTPDVPNDGKAFYAADSWVNLAQAGMRQQGDSLFDAENLNLDGDSYRRIWEAVCPPAITGAFAIYDGYSSDLSKTGDLVCSTGSSAGILFYGDTITHPDGRVERVEYSILPFPVFEGGEKIAIQRGNGMMVSKSDLTHEYASAVFLRWFTAPEQNMRFIASTGYLPVSKEAFENRMETEIERVEDYRIKKMLVAVTEMYRDYQFFVAPVFEGFDSMSKAYEQDFKQRMVSLHEKWIVSDGEASLEKMTAEALREWRGR